MFGELASRLISGVLKLPGFDRFWLTEIDHWFGPRWVGFEGKIFGAAGVRSRVRNDSVRLVLPPFHPHRVVVTRKSEKSANRLWREVTPERIHESRTSESNTRRVILNTVGHGVFAWISQNSMDSKKGAVMFYFIQEHGDSAWYLGFSQKGSEWTISKMVGISRPELDYLLSADRWSRDREIAAAWFIIDDRV